MRNARASVGTMITLQDEPKRYQAEWRMTSDDPWCPSLASAGGTLDEVLQDLNRRVVSEIDDPAEWRIVEYTGE